MDNFLICGNCQTQNPLYALNCKSCNSFLRSKISNIDLWDSIWNIFISPIDSAIKIIQAEKKNFVGSLLILWLIKAAINNYIIMSYASADYNLEVSFTKSLVEGGSISVIILLSFSFLMAHIFSLKKYRQDLEMF
jgi:hypothetical protein